MPGPQLNSSQDAVNVLAADLIKNKARELLQQIQMGHDVQVVILDLATAADRDKPYAVNGAWKSVWVAACSTGASVNFRPNNRQSFQGQIPLSINQVFFNDLGFVQSFLDWSAQAGKTMTLVFSTGEIRPGASVSTVTGTAAIDEGATVTSGSSVAVADTATLLSAADSTAKARVVENQGTKTMYLGGSTVTAKGGSKPGITVVPGAAYKYFGTGAFYGICDTGNSTTAALLGLLT